MQNFNLADIITADQDPDQIFQILELLGEGNFGSVYKGLHKPTGELVAIKLISSGGDIDSLKKEVIILKECQNDHIVKYYGSYYKNEQLWLIIEYCAAGSLIDIIKITRKQLTECEISCILQGTLKGLDYLHKQKKVHRDIKSGNILLSLQGIPKIADFGISAQLNHSLAYKDSCIGTPFWMSPEVISHSKYNQKTDIWSLGITAIELAEGEPPFSNLHPFRAMFCIQKKPPKGLTKPEKWSQNFNNFVSKCLQYDPQDRPSAESLLNDPFIQQYQSQKAILEELVLNSMDEIERYRINKQNQGDCDQYNSMISCVEEEKQEDYLRQNEDNFLRKNDQTVFLQNDEQSIDYGQTVVINQDINEYNQNTQSSYENINLQQNDNDKINNQSDFNRKTDDIDYKIDKKQDIGLEIGLNQLKIEQNEQIASQKIYNKQDLAQNSIKSNQQIIYNLKDLKINLTNLSPLFTKEFRNKIDKNLNQEIPNSDFEKSKLLKKQKITNKKLLKKKLAGTGEFNSMDMM